MEFRRRDDPTRTAFDVPSNRSGDRREQKEGDMEDDPTWVGPLDHTRRSDFRSLKPVIRVVGGLDSVLFRVLEPESALVVGRSETADITVHNFTVSRRHARISSDAMNQVTITDLGSRNGTYVHDRPVLSEVLHPGQRVNVGAVTLRLDLLDEGEIQHLEGLRRRLEMRVEKDPLTALANRNFLESPLPSYMDFHMGEGRPVSVVAIDVDNFKDVNDRLGSQVGDDVLRLIARKIEFTSRCTDVGMRYEEDRFMVFLFNSSADGAVTFAERLRHRIEKHPWEALAADLRVTCSFGVAEIHVAESLAAWIRRAQAAVRKAKESGRNQVEKAVPF